MKKNYPYLLLAAFLLSSLPDYGQNIGIGTSTPDASAQVDISSSSRGLLIPRMDSNAVKAIINPAPGLMVYDSSRKQLLVNMGTAAAADWENIVAKSGWSLTGNTGTGANSYLGTTDNTALQFEINNTPFGKLDPAYQSVSLGLDAGYGNIGEGVALGTYAQTANASNPIALGYFAMEKNTGDFNIGIGQQALQYSTGGSNIAIGSIALFNNNTGEANVGIGLEALQNTTNSNYNTAIGVNTGRAYDNGYNNVFLGANCDVNGAGYYNVIAIGQGVICTASSQARIGNSATNSIGGYADWTNFSDVRYKKNIREGVKGLDFIMRLRPITYNLDVTGIRNHLGQSAPKDEGTQQSIAARESELLTGFAAQEVEAAATAAGYEFSGVDRPKNANDFYGLRYGDFVVPLVKAVQEQQQLIKELQQEIADLKKQIQH
jgi:hypothetical protein